MDLFISLALLLALTILFCALERQRIADAGAYRTAVISFIAALIIHNPLVELLWHMPKLATVARIIGFLLLLFSFYMVCRSLGAPLGKPDNQPKLPH